MHQSPAAASTAERLDRALDEVLGGARPVADPELRRLVTTGGVLAAVLRPIPVSDHFAERLRARLEHPGTVARVSEAMSALARYRPGWLVVTGAVSTAAVGVGVTAFAVWRGTRRAGHR